MINETVAGRYAQALYESGRDNGNLERLEADLTAIVTAMDQEPGFKKVLFNPLISPADKQRLVEEVFGGQVSRVTLQLVKLLLHKKRERHLEAVLAEFRRLGNAARNVLEAEAVFAVPVDKKIEADLRGRLEETSGKLVRLRVAVDPAIMGGVVLKVGDKRYDGSLRTRLAGMKAAIREARI